MRITKIGTDYVKMDENNFDKKEFRDISKIHIIKMNFKNDIKGNIGNIIKMYPRTKRYIIENNIREYNSVLKHTSKKFYVENKKYDKLISFFRKNNKVVLNIERLTDFEVEFVKLNITDILQNVEVLYVGDMKDLFEDLRSSFEKWNGNVILNE